LAIHSLLTDCRATAVLLVVNGPNLQQDRCGRDYRQK
jgi:hypothetical protein